MNKVNIPEGQSGDWKVEKFEVTEEGAKFHNLKCMINRNTRLIHPDIYTRLIYHGTTIMSDTPAEMDDHWEVVYKGKGKILINGLGLGMVVVACLEKPEVEHVTVIEISEDVIKLVAPTLKKRYGDKLTIIRANALEWKPEKGEKYDVVWHDIWTNICGDNLEEMKLLHRRYGKRCEWQGSWAREYL